jgi:hypothetical protein
MSRIVRRPSLCIRNHEPIVPTRPGASDIIDMLNDWTVGRPACCMKYALPSFSMNFPTGHQKTYKYPIILVPQMVCAIHAKQTISVLRRSVPLKRSLHLVPSFIFFSNSLVCSIIAIVSSGLKLGLLPVEVSRSNAARAPALSPRRTYTTSMSCPYGSLARNLHATRATLEPEQLQLQLEAAISIGLRTEFCTPTGPHAAHKPD